MQRGGALQDIASQLTDQPIGAALHKFAADIYPICRSITGDGVRATLRHVAKLIELEVHEVPSGSTVLDWTVPREWNIRDAYIRDPSGTKVVDFLEHSLHVMGYSIPVNRRMPLAELQPHLHSMPQQPEVIPYRTSYYREDWGFCLPHRLRSGLADGTYEVVIDSTLADGALTYGEYFHRGTSDDEVLLSAHVCHPSLANDNCSGIALLAHLAARLKGLSTRYSYRILFAPGTIGAITWLARNRERASRIKHGLIVSCVGDAGGPIYKRSRNGAEFIDRTMSHIIAHRGGTGRVIDFSPYGYDERQYCSPGFDLPVGLLQRSLFEHFPEYHTSADNLDFIKPEHLEESWRMVAAAIDIIENDGTYRNVLPFGEPQLGRRGLYDAIGGKTSTSSSKMAMLWVLNLSDGKHSLLDIAERAGLPFAEIRATAATLADHGLIVPAP